MAIKQFLDKLRPVAATKNVFRFVTGNQSADMDSVVSAITYAYFYNQKYPLEPPFLPLVNITRDELRLRRDIVLLLQSHSITKDELFFLDDVQELTAGAKSLLEVVLVDHCGLQGELLNQLYDEQRLKVVGIIDHHADENSFTDASPRIIHTNGSCSALVFNYWNKQLGGIDDKQVVSLLLGPLLIDTSNMTQKVEAGDTEAFAKYKSILLDGPALVETKLAVGGSPSTDNLYSTLKTAKKDLDGFLFFDILRKDYKQFKFVTQAGTSVTIGFSSLGKSISWILKKFSAVEVVDTLDQMVKTFHLDVVVITTSYTKKENDEYTREFCFHPRKAGLENLADFAEPLKLDDNIYNKAAVEAVTTEVNKSRPFHVFNQVNIYASRKQVVPVVKSIIEEKVLL